MDSLPEQRRVTVALLTPLGWINGTLHLPPMQRLVDFLQAGATIVKVTRARIPQRPELVPFVALRADAIVLVAPTIDELIDVAPPRGHTSPREIEILLDEGRLTGRLDVLLNLRVSDFLRQHAGLVVLRDAAYTPHGAADPVLTRRMPVAVVNLARAAAVAQTGANRR